MSDTHKLLSKFFFHLLFSALLFFFHTVFLAFLLLMIYGTEIMLYCRTNTHTHTHLYTCLREAKLPLLAGSVWDYTESCGHYGFFRSVKNRCALSISESMSNKLKIISKISSQCGPHQVQKCGQVSEKSTQNSRLRCFCRWPHMELLTVVLSKENYAKFAKRLFHFFQIFNNYMWDQRTEQLKVHAQTCCLTVQPISVVPLSLTLSLTVT